MSVKMGTNSIVFEGVLEKTAAGIFKNKTKVWTVLLGNSLTYYKNNKRSSCIGSIDMTEVRRVRQKVETKGGTQFEIGTSSKSYTFTAETAQLCSTWVSVLQRSMLHTPSEHSRCSTGDGYATINDIQQIVKPFQSTTDSRDTRVSEVYEELENLPSPTAPVFGVKLKSRRSSKDSRHSSTSQHKSRTVHTMDSNLPSTPNHISPISANETRETHPTSTNETAERENGMPCVTTQSTIDINAAEHSETGTPLDGGDNVFKFDGSSVSNLSNGTDNGPRVTGNAEHEDEHNITTVSRDNQIQSSNVNSNTLIHNETVVDDCEASHSTTTNSLDERDCSEHVAALITMITPPLLPPDNTVDQSAIHPRDIVDKGPGELSLEDVPDEFNTGMHVHIDRTKDTLEGEAEVDISSVQMRNSTRSFARSTFMRKSKSEDVVGSAMYNVDDDRHYDDIVARSRASVQLALSDNDSSAEENDEVYCTADALSKLMLEDKGTEGNSSLDNNVEEETEPKSDAYQRLWKYISEHDADFDLDAYEVVSEDAVNKLHNLIEHTV